jgi:hypothetical protein
MGANIGKILATSKEIGDYFAFFFFFTHNYLRANARSDAHERKQVTPPSPLTPNTDYQRVTEAGGNT